MIKTLLTLSILLCVASFSLVAQSVIDDFSDGELSVNPTWTGSLNDFRVNESFQLQLNYQNANLQPSYLSTNVQGITLDNKEWRFDIRLDFSPSSSNKVQLYLTSTTADLLNHQESGSLQQAYFLEIGESGSDDGISLFYRNGENTTLIARGGDGDFSSDFDTRIRVRRDAAANWEIAVDQDKTDEFITIATGNDSSLSDMASMGLACFFTSTRRSLFYFDNLYFGENIPDDCPPQLLTYEVLNDYEIELVFSEEVEQTSATAPLNYLLSPDDTRPSYIIHDINRVRIRFANPFESGTNYKLLLENISDLNENLSVPETLEFFFFKVEEAEVGDIVITEFFPDPTPVLGLPDEEFVELYNRSDKYIDLLGWEISDNTSSSGTLPNYIMRPGEYLILAPSSAQDKYSDFGKVLIPSSWRSLNNGGDSLTISNSQGIQVDGLGYSLNWYQDEEKAEGGYSLEIINPNLGCFDQNNWKASESQQGGTPANENSVADFSFSGSAPQIVSFKALSRTQLELSFDKEMKAQALLSATYTLSPDIEISEVQLSSTENDIVQLTLLSEIEESVFYELKIDQVEDCNGNRVENLTASFLYDQAPPQLDSIFFLADSILLLTFDEPFQVDEAMSVDTYGLAPNIGLIEAKAWNDTQIVLIYENDWIRGFTYSLFISGLSDMMGNQLEGFETDVVLKNSTRPSFNELLITELMANPKEDQELPNREYVEVFNPTSTTKSLVEVFFMDERDTVNLGLNYILPGEHLLLAPNSAVQDLAPYGRVLGLSSWPNLNNSGDDLQLSNDETIIHQVFYREEWYKEDFKYEEGGWSLEMIDLKNPCLGFSNWRASISNLQGTPGSENSVIEANLDQLGPQIQAVFAPNAREVYVYFTEPLEITKIRESQFSVYPDLMVKAVEIFELSVVKITLAEDLKPKTRYQIKAENITDCVGNIISSSGQEAFFALAESAENGDVVLNEILYDQKASGADFIELLNVSDKYINLRGWTVESTSAKNTILQNRDVVISPGQYLALTTDKLSVMKDYPTSHDEKNLLEVDLPAFSNGEGMVTIQSADRSLEEHFEYSDDLHLPFLRTVDGVSLERINPEAPIQETYSWSSAAASVGFATPGKVNSQLTNENTSFGSIEANPKTFAHDQPGRNFTLINYELENAGNMATLKIFDLKGSLVSTLANNETLSTSGFFRWDGVDSNGRKVGTGYYIIYFEIFTTEGDIKVIKERVAVGF